MPNAGVRHLLVQVGELLEPNGINTLVAILERTEYEVIRVLVLLPVVKPQDEIVDTRDLASRAIRASVQREAPVTTMCPGLAGLAANGASDLLDRKSTRLNSSH